MVSVSVDVNLFLLPLFFIAGAIVGSVFTAVIYRVPNQLAVIKKYACRHCNSSIKGAGLIPILSYVLLGGKCRSCKKKISVHYVIIEMLTALSFMFLYAFYGFGFELLLYLALWSMLIITFFIDLEHMVVSDAVLFTFLPFVAVYLLFTNAPWLYHVLGLVVGFAVFLAIYIAAKRFYGKEAFGFGDVMLSGAVGAFLGWDRAILVLILSFIIAFVVIVFLRIVGKQLKREMEIPFGPFVCVAAAIASLYGNEIIQLYWGINVV